MRIGLIAPAAREPSGIAAYAQALEQALVGRGVEVRRLLEEGDAPENIGERVRALGVDLVHCEMGGGRFREFACLEQLVSDGVGVPFTITAHDPERLVWSLRYFSLGQRSQAVQRLLAVLTSGRTLRRERAVARRAGAVIALTDTGRLAVQRRLQLAPERAVAIPHGVWLQAFRPVATDPVKILCFGYLYRGKGYEDLLCALARLVETSSGLRDSCSVTIAGGTNPALNIDGLNSYVEELKRLTGELGLGAMVSFVTDIEEQRIAPLIAEHSLVVLPYHNSFKIRLLGRLQGASGALARALGCGRGLVCSNARSFSEEVDGGIGTTYKGGDVRALTEVLRAILSDSALLERWALAAYQKAEQRSWDRVAGQFVSIFERAAAAAPAHRCAHQ